MTDQPDTTATELQATLAQAIQRARSLERTILQLKESLARKGMEITTDVQGAVQHLTWSLSYAQRQGEAISQRLDQLQNLIRTSALVTSSLELEQVLEEVLDSVCRLTGAERAYLMLREGRARDTHVPTDLNSLRIQAARNWGHEGITDAEAQFSRTVVQDALSKAVPIVTTNAQADERFKDQASVVAQGLRSVVCIPLIVRRIVVGVLYADNRIQSGLFSPSNVPLLEAFGTQAAVAIERARLHMEELQRQRYEEELALAQRIQLSLLPSNFPEVPGWSFAATYRPARVVGGDFYDIFGVRQQKYGLVISDVAGKGVPAALFMATSRTTIRSAALSHPDPADTLVEANRLIYADTRADLFLSSFYAVLGAGGGQVRFSNAGHNDPLWFHAETGAVEPVRLRGIVLGVLPDIALAQSAVELAPGDMLLFYTDGVTEAMNEADEEFGEERLMQVLQRYGDADLIDLMRRLDAAVRDFVGDAAQSDDFTAVAARYTGA
ncbi:MAG: SpoIIE family protein phosphatase [Anaerolineae bacterium]|nr:SpoIIE family protein phosphatase [Anaerolineae bacterium]